MRLAQKTARTILAAWLGVAVTTPAYADGLRAAAEKSAQRAGEQAMMQPRSKTMKWTGLGLFAGGMSVGLFAFINNKNGSYAEFGEANAVDKKLGAAGLAAAFAGGALMFAGTRRGPAAAPAVKIEPSAVTISKQVSW